MARCAATRSTSCRGWPSASVRAPEDLKVEDRILDRDRDVVLRLILDGAEHLGLGHLRHVDVADDDLLVADADLAARPRRPFL